MQVNVETGHIDERELAQQRLVATARRSGESWRRLGLRIRGVTPMALARGMLAIGALALVGWLFTTSWLELIPFQIGLVLAYVTLPLVNSLDRFMPRSLAALLVVALELASLALLLGLLIPPLVQELSGLLGTLPGASFELRDRVAELQVRLQALPEPVQVFIVDGLRQGAVVARDNLLVYLQALAGIAVATALRLLNTLGFILGFLAIPTWILAVLTDQRVGVRVIDHLLPDWLRPDFWGVVRIADRTLGVYLRGQFVLALVVGGLTFLGFRVLRLLGWPVPEYALLLSMIAGVANFIPSVGPILAVIPALLAGLTLSVESTLAILVMYLAVNQIKSWLLAPRIEHRSVDIHPAVVVVVVVALSRFGLFWALLAAPIAVLARDLFRYLYGRLSEPPRPAGVLPGPLDLASPRRALPVGNRRARLGASPYRGVATRPPGGVA